MATNPDKIATTFATTPTILNTGVDEIAYSNSILRAMVYDGATPSIVCELNGNTGVPFPLPSGATNPDVALYSNGTTTYAFVVFINSVGRATCNRYTYNASTNQFTSAAAKTVSSQASGCTNPNIDITPSGEAVVVYEHNNAIFARSYNVSNTLSWPASAFAQEIVDDPFGDLENYHPDVAVNKKGNNVVVSFIYVNDDVVNAAKETAVLQMPFSSVGITATPSGISGIPVVQAPSYTDVMQYPRITAPHSPSHFNDNDFAAVVQVNNDVYSAVTNDNFSNVYSVALTNSAQFGNGNNEKPVVTYSGDNVIVAWSYGDAGKLGTNNKEVLATRLYWGGVPVTVDFSVVNLKTNGNQFAPSIVGNINPGNTFYMFVDEDQKAILYKESHWLNSSLRTANPNGTSATNPFAPNLLKIYPNPITDQSQMEITLKEGDVVKSLSLYNLAGQKVANFETSNLVPGVNQLSLHSKQTENLQKGMYVLRFITNNTQQTVKIQK
ncbi:T9SS type A sorting domain-containing protein [Adhaeribacter sp. BT258]|uniref:T9SS type A sorting domain-containing protein n=1 Tax=Adhaeribacter terrigena TaxID=2793070 RepID=A0ABS1C4D8_9BACT|nr:T9SS type A sorting domain-containing protein [Adhaeribacter terrigena]MBK0403385.1 T9SS type A sorting domain-containing protein [Adhaeribacter terrigena]